MSMLVFNVITLFPNLFEEFLKNMPFKRAAEKGLIEVNLINLRDFAIDNYRTVDDRPYGGGVGMILMIEPIYKALEKAGVKKGDENSKIVTLSPKGNKYNQKKAKEYSNLDKITLICGRYEGMDARVKKHLADESTSIGNYLTSGGEIPALVIMESVTRLLPGVLEKDSAVKIESFNDDSLEYPQYTRPENFKGLKVPKVLLSGNHGEIEKWRKKNKRKIIQ